MPGSSRIPIPLFLSAAIAVLIVGSTAVLRARTAATPRLSTTTRVEVDDAGAFTRTALRGGATTVDRSTGHVSLSAPGLQWEIADGGLAYIPTRVALTARGNLAFYGCHLNNERTRLFASSTGTPGDAPLWSDTALLGTYGDIEVGASDDGDVFAAVAQFPVGGDIARRTVVLLRYGSGGGPLWAWTAPDTINAGARVAVSDDASSIALVYTDDAAGTVEIAFFESGTETPLFTDSFAGGFVRALDITRNGRLLYISEGTNVRIYDTEARAIRFTVDAGASFDSHTISGDGSRFAFGGFNFVKVYAWNGSTWALQFTHTMSGAVYCARCDLSEDGTVLAAAFWNYGTGLDFHVLSIDATTGGLNFQGDFTGGGAYQNVPQQIVASADGGRIAYGGWGDQLDTNPEVMIFEGTPVPVASIDTRGSVFDVDMSADGVFVASGSKSVHANVTGNGGDHACFYTGGQDLTVDGVPALSNTITFRIEGIPGEEALLAGSLNEVDIQTGIGTLVVDPDAYVELGGGVIPRSGLLELDVAVPGSPGLIGRKVVAQALKRGGNVPHLTNGRALWILP